MSTADPTPQEGRPGQGALPPVLAEWVDALCADLGVDRGLVQMEPLLDITREVAHGVARPAGPLTTFIIALAAASGGDSASSREALERAIRTTEALVASWPDRRTSSSTD